MTSDAVKQHLLDAMLVPIIPRSKQPSTEQLTLTRLICNSRIGILVAEHFYVSAVRYTPDFSVRHTTVKHMEAIYRCRFLSRIYGVTDYVGKVGSDIIYKVVKSIPENQDTLPAVTIFNALHSLGRDIVGDEVIAYINTEMPKLMRRIGVYFQADMDETLKALFLTGGDFDGAIGDQFENHTIENITEKVNLFTVNPNENTLRIFWDQTRHLHGIFYIRVLPAGWESTNSKVTQDYVRQCLPIIVDNYTKHVDLRVIFLYETTVTVTETCYGRMTSKLSGRDILYGCLAYWNDNGVLHLRESGVLELTKGWKTLKE